jgi:hypothetical protein
MAVIATLILTPIVFSQFALSEECFFWIVFWDTLLVLPVFAFVGKLWSLN